MKAVTRSLFSWMEQAPAERAGRALLGRSQKFLRTDGAQILLLALVTAATFTPFLFSPAAVLVPNSGLGTDISYRHWPDLVNYSRVLRDERTIPLWDDAIALGRPLAGDPGVLWLYPFGIVFVFLPPAYAFTVLGALHVFLAGALTYGFLRRGFGTSRMAATIAALSFMLMPKLVSHLAGGHLGLVWGITWLPLALWATRATIHEKKWQMAPWGGFALAIQLPTHIQASFYTAALVGLYAIWLLLSLASRTRCLRQAWLEVAWSSVRFLVMVVCSILFAAAFLWPLAELMPYASRQGFTLTDASWWSLPPLLLSTLIVPAPVQFPEWTLYLGVVPTTLAVLGLFLSRRRDTRFFSVVVVLALLYMLGPLTPIFPLMHRLPGFSYLRVPPRIWFVAGFVVCLMAGLGADALLEYRARLLPGAPARRVALSDAIGLGGGLLAILAQLAAGPGETPIVVIPATASALASVIFRIRRVTWRWSGAALTALVLIDLLPLARTHFDRVEADDFVRTTPLLERIEASSGDYRVYVAGGDWPYAAAAERGIESVNGLLAFQMGHAVELIKLATGCMLDGYATGIPPCLTAEIDPEAYRRALPDAQLLGLLNTRYVVTPMELDHPDFVPVARFGEQRLYQNQREQPRAFVVGAVRRLRDHTTVLAALPDVDPARVALITEPLPSTLSDPRPAAEARITTNLTNRTVVEVALDNPGFLVLSRTWAPGWQVTDNGSVTKLYRTNYALQGVHLAPGAHTLEFVYQPAGWIFGRWITASSLAAWIIIGWVFNRRRKHRQVA